LDEIARRRSATTSTTSVDLSTAPPPSETTTTNLDALSIKPFAASESLPSTPLPTPPRHRSKSFSFPDEKCRPFVPSSPSKKQQEVTTHDVDMRKASSLDERRSSKESSTTSRILPTQPTNNNKPMISNNQKNNSTNGLKTNSRAQQLMASPPSKSSSYHEPSSSYSAPLFGSLAVVSAAEQHHSQKPQNNGKGVNRDSKKRFGDREGAVRSAGLDDGASVFTPNAEPIVNPKSKSPSPARSPPRAQSSSITSPSLINTGGVPPNPMGKPFKRKGSGAPDNPGSFNEKWSRGSGKKSGMKNTQSFDEKSKPKNDDEDEGGGGSANRGKKLRKLRTKLLRLAPGWSESRWGSTQSQDSWNTPVTSHQDHGSSGGGGNLVTEPVPVLNDSLRMRLDRCVEKLRKFRDSSYGGGKGGQKSPALKAVNSHQSSSGVSEIETSLHDLGRLLSDLSMGVGASTSAQSAAVQRRIRESGGLELLQQLTAPRHGVFNSTAAPLAMDALSHCFACQATQRDFVLAVDAGVGVVDAATYALELVMNTENSLVPQLTRQSNESSSNHFGTTTGSNRSLASLSAMVERTNPHPAPSRPSSSIKTEPSSVSNSSSVNPWEMLNTTILLLMHLLRHSAAPGLEVAQESMVRFLCVTGFLQDLVSLLIGSRAGNWTSIASIAIGESTQSSSSSSLLGSDRRYQLLTNVEARTLLRRSLALLEAVAAFPLVLTNEGEDMMKPKDGSVVSPSMLVCQTMSNVSTVNVDAGRAASGVRRLLEDTNAAGVFTILTEIVRYNTPPTTTDLTVHQNKSISSVASIKLSDECLELCISSLSCLNNIARLNLELFQKVLIPNKVLSVCNILFNSVNTNTNNSRMSRISKYLLSELIIFVGFFVLDEPSNQILLLEDLSHLNHTNSKPQQQLVSSRRKKTIDDLEDEEQLNINTTSSSTTTVSEEKDDEHILHYLMSLPREKLSDQNELYPTLLAASHKNDSIQQYLGEEFMDELKTYIETNTEAMNQSSSEAANVSGGDIKKSNSSSPPSSTLRIEVVPDGSAYPFWVALSHRFPIEFWMGKGGLVANSAIDRCTEAV
jgi:hypothetical protein